MSGPLFTRVEEVPFDATAKYGDVVRFRTEPLIVRGAAAALAPQLLASWTFEQLAQRCRDSVPRFTAPDLIEQGETAPRVRVQPGAFMQQLAAQQTAGVRVAGLAPPGSAAAEALAAGRPTALDFAAYAAAGVGAGGLGYDSQVAIDSFMPGCRRELDGLLALWPPGSTTYHFSWVGPAGTLTGLHWDYPHNWLSMLVGQKEVLLIPAAQAHLLPTTDKYDYGAELCAVSLPEFGRGGGGAAAELLRQARGWHCVLEAGDALFIPRRCHHAVHGLQPSISISTFGHSPYQLVTTGLGMVLGDWLHKAGLYNGRQAWGRCTCHPAGARRPLLGRAILAATAAAVTAAAAAYMRRG